MGTIFHSAKLPLTIWVAAIHLIVAVNNGISSVELSRRLGQQAGRGAHSKTPFVAAVPADPDGRSRQVRLAPVKGFRKREIADGAG